jgi:membrane protein implicated in regulation of membrane protease activity
MMDNTTNSTHRRPAGWIIALGLTTQWLAVATALVMGFPAGNAFIITLLAGATTVFVLHRWLRRRGHFPMPDRTGREVAAEKRIRADRD